MLIKTIEFVFENCEGIIIDGKYVGNIYIGDIKTEIARMACNHIGMEEICYSFYIELHKDADKEYNPFGDTNDKQTTFKRFLAYNDITQINVILYDQYAETEEEKKEIKKVYLLHWTGDSEMENASQKVYKAKTDWLYIVVDENKSIEDTFDLETIDDAEHADFVASMYDIGDKYFAESEQRKAKYATHNRKIDSKDELNDFLDEFDFERYQTTKMSSVYFLVKYNDTTRPIYFCKIDDAWFASPCSLNKLKMDRNDVANFVESIYEPSAFNDALEYELTMYKDGYHYDINTPQCAPFLPEKIEIVKPLTETECLEYLLEQE